MIQWQYFYLNLTGSYPTDSHSREVKYKWVKLARENSHSFGQADCFVQVISTGIFFISPSFSPPLCCPCALSQIGCPRRSPMIDCLFSAVSSAEFVDWRTASMISYTYSVRNWRFTLSFDSDVKHLKFSKCFFFCSYTDHGSPEGEVPLY